MWESNGLSVVPGIANQHGNGNVVSARVEGNSNRTNGNQIRCYNYRGEGHYASNCTVKPRKPLLISSKTEAAKFVRDFKSLAKEANESLAKHKALKLEIERLLRAVVSQDVMSIVQSNSVVDTSNLQIELEQCKYEKISFDRAYNDMQQKIEWLQAQLGDLKGKSKDTPCVSDTLDPLSQKLKNENVELEFQVLNYAKENAHLKTTYKNLFDSIKVTRAQTKAIIDSLQDKLHDTIYENAKLRAQLFDKVSKQKDTNKDTSVNTQFRKQSILGKLPFSSGPKLYSVTPLPKSKVLPRNGFSPNNVENTTRTRRPQPRNNPKNDKVLLKSKSSCLLNKLEKKEENHKSLQSSKFPYGVPEGFGIRLWCDSGGAEVMGVVRPGYGEEVVAGDGAGWMGW
ncbi:hypothetical protein Tco_0462458 [Tanacetum coccineum]